MTSGNLPSERNEDEIDLGALLGRLIDHKWQIIVVTGSSFTSR